jgi:NADH-quinone oxidoreductase subunit G
VPVSAPAPAETSDGQGLRLGTFRSIWASPEVEHAPALQFLTARQRAEMAPDDAARLGLADGARVVVSNNGSAVDATVALRHAMPAGTVFLQDGLDDDNSANALTGSIVQVRPSTTHAAAAHPERGSGVVE